tara:strand:+ start:44 stop:607 length:564 start_codon:yes stop_codon:yes gene_type:complete
MNTILASCIVHRNKPNPDFSCLSIQYLQNQQTGNPNTRETSMSTISLDNILNIFSGAALSAPELEQLRNDIMFVTLARATSADTNIQNREVERVITVLKTHTGNDYSAADIRVAAQSAIFESVSLQRYLNGSAKKIAWQDRLIIVHALIDVIRSDGRTSDMEITFFNDVVTALKLTPAQLAGLDAES